MTIIHFLVSILSSIVGAISGIGGGVIIKPVLDSLRLYSPTTISFLSSTTVLAMTSVALLRSRKSPVTLDKKISLFMAIGGIAGGLAGRFVFSVFQESFGNEAVIGATQSIILAVLTLSVFFTHIYKSRIKSFDLRYWYVSFSAGLFLGGLATFLGIGGGPFNLIVLFLLFSMDTKTAALNSIFIIFCSQIANLLLTTASGRIPDFPPAILIFMVLGGITGGLAGSFLSKKMSNRHVDYLFSAITVLITVMSCVNFFRYYIQI